MLKFVGSLSLVLLSLYAVAWLIGPNFDLWLPPRSPCDGGLTRVRQLRTVADVRNTGTALMTWMRDERQADSHISAKTVTTSRSAVVDPTVYGVVKYEAVVQHLHPAEDFFYMKHVPFEDGWGRPIEVRFLGSSIPPDEVLVRSAGCDGSFEEGDYETGAFVATDYSKDIVWANGDLIRWPASGAPVRPRPLSDKGTSRDAILFTAHQAHPTGIHQTGGGLRSQSHDRR